MTSTAVAATIVCCFSASVRGDALDAPEYYNSAAGLTGSALKSRLYTITSTGFIARNYGAARYALAKTDADPNNAANVLLMYNRASVSNDWDEGLSWNREHIWPQSLLGVDIENSYTGAASDLFELRPANPRINSDRSNTPFGKSTVANLPSTYGNVSDGTGTYWYPSKADSGDAARTMFYMATRYGQSQSRNLSLVNGQPSVGQMGDLASLLRWHYQDPVDSFERKKNHVIYTDATYKQNNRNPFIDRPEYVWSIFGTSANNSQLSVATASSDGSSAATVNLGRVIAGSAFGSQSVTLNKSGTTPTTFDATVAGSATSTLNGPRNAFDYNAGSRTITVGLSGSTSTTGTRSGTITFDNTDLTTASAGTGSADGNDVVNVTGDVVSHARPSLAADSLVTALMLNFGIVARGSVAPVGNVSVLNQGTVGSYVAGLDIDAVNRTGDTAAFTTQLGTLKNLDVGTDLSWSVVANTDIVGQHDAAYSILTSDQDIPGATNLATLSLSFSARVAIGGDASLDDAVNFADLVILAQNYNAVDTDWTRGDFDRSNTTNFADLVVLAQNYNTSAANLMALGVEASFAADWARAQTVVPEPATLMLFAAATTVGLRRRRA